MPVDDWDSANDDELHDPWDSPFEEPEMEDVGPNIGGCLACFISAAIVIGCFALLWVWITSS